MVLPRSWNLLTHIRRRPRCGLAALALLVVAVAAGGWYWWGSYHLRAAEHALKRRDFDDARVHLARCLKAWPRSGHAHLLLAQAARRSGSYDEASNELPAARAQGCAPATCDLEATLLRCQQGDLSVEPDLWARVERDDPDSDLILEVLAQAYIDTDQLGRARHCLDLFLERRPEDVQALLGRGWVWEQLFYYDKAAADYRRAVQLDPDNDRARLRLAEALLRAAPPREAADQFERLLRRQPENAAARLGLARARLQLGEAQEARRLLDQLLAEHPRDPAAVLERGKLALDEGKLSAAETWLRRAVALTPFDPQANYHLYLCLDRLKQPEAGKYRARFERLDADLKRVAELTRAVMQSPGDASLRCEAGIIFLRDGEERKGLHWLELALQQDPGLREAHEALASYFESKRQPERAAYHRHLARAGRLEAPALLGGTGVPVDR